MRSRFIFSVLILFTVFTYSGSHKSKDFTVVATVGTCQIYLSDFADRYTDYLIAAGVDDNIVVREAILNNMINEIILYNYDSNENIFSNKEYQREREWSRKQAILAYLKDQEVYAKITVSDEELRQAFYRVNEQIAARHLYAPTEEEANKLYHLLKIGVPFETLAHQVFSDSTLQNNGGYIGYFTWGDMDPAFEEAAYSLKVGEVSKPVKTAYGYSIIKLEDRVAHPLLTEYEFQTKKKKLERVLKIRKKKPYEIEYLNKIFDRSKVKFNEKSIRNIFTDITQNNLSQIENKIKNPPEAVCVSYEGNSFSQEEIERRIDEIPFYHRKKITSVKNLKTIIEGLLIQEKLYEIAEDKGFDRTPIVLNTIKKLYDNVYLQYKSDEILQKSDVPDSAVIAYYKENIDFFSTPEEINVQEIIVDRKPLADSLIRLLSDGKDFGETAKRYSVRQWSAANNGVLGYSPAASYGKFKDTFWNARAGELIGPLAFDRYYGIFKVLGKKESKPLEFEKVKNEVSYALKYQNKRYLMQKYVSELRKKAKIHINLNMLSAYRVVNNKSL